MSDLSEDILGDLELDELGAPNPRYGDPMSKDKHEDMLDQAEEQPRVPVEQKNPLVLKLEELLDPEINELIRIPYGSRNINLLDHTLHGGALKQACQYAINEIRKAMPAPKAKEEK